VHFLSNGGDRGLRVRVITAAAVRLWCLIVCLWRVDRLFVTSRLRDESTGWRVDRVTSWLAAVRYRIRTVRARYQTVMFSVVMHVILQELKTREYRLKRHQQPCGWSFKSISFS